MKKILCSLFVLMASLSFAEQKFDWSTVLVIPPISSYEPGNQILHFKSKNKPYTLDSQAVAFVENYFSNSRVCHSEAEVLRVGSDAVTISGAYIEMGVCTGRTINFIAGLNPYQKVYGFDSFEGLPDVWERADASHKKGTFAFHNPEILPPVLHNVILKKGLFKDSLPQFKEEVLKDQPIAFLHIDCDIYSSTADTFNLLGDNIVEGTIIVFDEFYNYPGYENHEFKAFNEFLAEKGFTAEFIAYNAFHEQVAVKISR